MEWKLSDIVKQCRQLEITQPAHISHLVDKMSQMPAKAMGHPKSDKVRGMVFELARFPLAQAGAITYLDLVDMLACNPARDAGWWEDVLYYLGQIVVGIVPRPKEACSK